MEVDEIALALVKLIKASGVPSRAPSMTLSLMAECMTTPSARGVALLTWDHVENVLNTEGVHHALPPPADSRALKKLDGAIQDRFQCAPPKVLRELLSFHNGISDAKWTAFFSVERMLEYIDVFGDVDPTLFAISGSSIGDNVVLRLDSSASDHEYVYAFWHEDYAESGLQPHASNVAEYLTLAGEAIIDTIRDVYRGPIEV